MVSYCHVLLKVKCFKKMYLNTKLLPFRVIFFQLIDELVFPVAMKKWAPISINIREKQRLKR